MKIILFGTGAGAEIVLKSLDLDNVEIICFFDNNKEKQGSSIMGYKIDNPNNINKLKFDYIIIASQFVKEIQEQLNLLGIENEKIIRYFNIYNNHSDEKFNKYLEERIFNFDNIIQMYFPNVEVNPKGYFPLIGENPTYLFFNHLYGGGTQVYQESYINSLGSKTSIILAHIVLNHLVLVYIDKDRNLKQCVYVNIGELNQQSFNNILEINGVDLIYVNQLVSFPVKKFIGLIQNSTVPYLYFIHDYFCVCPSFNLINFQGKYCNAEKNVEICQSCISNKLVTSEAIRMDGKNIDIKEWRNIFHNFLLSASKIVAPSKSTKNIVLSYYPDVEIEVREHDIDKSTFKKTFSSKYAVNGILNIAFIGNINQAKGSGLIYNLIDMVRENKDPIRIKVIGSTEKHNKYFKSEDEIFEVYGPYERENLSDILKEYKISLVIIPALWPETYNYTTSEVMESGYPVVTFNLGAPAERVKRTGGGWIVDHRNVESIYSLLCEIENNRKSILQKRSCL